MIPSARQYVSRHHIDLSWLRFRKASSNCNSLVKKHQQKFSSLSYFSHKTNYFYANNCSRNIQHHPNFIDFQSKRFGTFSNDSNNNNPMCSNACSISLFSSPSHSIICGNHSRLLKKYYSSESEPLKSNCYKDDVKAPPCTVAATNETISNTDFDIHLTLPQKFVKSCPAAVQPYLQLLRLDRPIGTWLLFWPCAWGIAVAAAPASYPDPYLLGLFGTGALVMRGAGCTINDLWDRDIDAKVERTQDRPLASGAVKPFDAVVFLGGQLGVGLLVLLQLNWPSVLLGASSLGLVCLYPLVKRVSHWPQLVLGLTFNWGVLLGWTAVHGNLSLLPILPFYTAGVFWTLIYDTIYAHQDKSDDMLIGIKSTALKFGDDTAMWLTGFSVAMVTSLVAGGYSAQLAWPFYAAVSATALNLAHQIYHLDIDNRAHCGRQFRHNRHVGLLVFLGIVAGSLLAQQQQPNNNKEVPSNINNKVLALQ